MARAAASCSRVVEEDDRTVLLAVVGALAIELGGIVNVEEDAQQVFVGNLGGIVIDFDDLGMAGAVGAHVLIGGIGSVPPAYPTATSITPLTWRKALSIPQKHPAPKVALAMVVSPVKFMKCN